MAEGIGKTKKEEGISMATYIVLYRFTRKGLENIKESPARID